MRRVPLLGVNLGSLGFMSELEVSEMHLLKNLADDQFKCEKRMMLDVTVERDGRTIYTNSGLNDAVITKGAIARVVRLQVTAGTENIGRFSGDGVIVATPTGSTGYSLSAGGPIVEPTAQNFVISPICAHTGFPTSFVLSATGHVTVSSAEQGRNKQIFLSVDGGKALRMNIGDVARISKSEFVTKLVRLKDRSFYDVVNMKFKTAKFIR